MNRTVFLLVLLHALPVAALVLALFYYWFAVADRYVVFLYYHDMGPTVPDTSPFSPVTSSRYWMAGLVASGLTTLLYSGVIWLLGRLRQGYRPPAWWLVWLFTSAPVVVALPLITMTTNEPTLPLLNAAQTTLATVIGLGLAVASGGSYYVSAADNFFSRNPGLQVLSWLAGAVVAGGVTQLRRRLYA